jgi:NADPH-dependent 2,4-dienoyl-CoA reductase/sulfur reductase-like enzyme
MEKVPFERVLGPAVGKTMMGMLKNQGINMEMEQSVARFEPGANNKVAQVVLKQDRTIPADIVVLGAGVVPKTDFLKSSGITIDKDGGISVDGSMRVPGFEGVFAVGDIARYPYHLTGENIRVEHWSVAQNQGRVAAESIMAEIDSIKLPVFKQIPFFWTMFFGKSIRYVGHASVFDDTIIHVNFIN